MTLYMTQLTVYHGDRLTEVDKSVLLGQVGKYACVNQVRVYGMECKQVEVSVQELREQEDTEAC